MADTILDTIVKKWYLWLPLLFYFVFKDRSGEVVIYVATQWIALYYFALCHGWALNEQGKYASPQLVVNSEHICVDKPIIAGDWAIFTDFVFAPKYFMTFPLKQTTIIVPAKTLYQVGKNYFSTTRVVRKHFYRIPYHAQQIIATYDYNRDNIFFGHFSETIERELEKELKGTGQSLEQLKETVDIYRDLATKNRESAQMNLGDYEGVKSHFDRIAPKPETLFEKATAVEHNEEELRKDQA